MIRWFLYPVGDSYLVAAAAAVALLLLLGIGPAREKISPRRRGVLIAVRSAVFAMIVLAMLRPTLVVMETRKQSATLIVLADQSRSMTIRDDLNGRSRWEALREAVANARGGLQSLGREIEVKAYTFDSEPRPAKLVDGRIELPDAPDGAQTAIGYTLEEVLRQEAGKRVLGVFLLSDGAQRTVPPRDALPQTAAARMKHLGQPLYTIRFGQSRGQGQVQDAAVTDLVADPTVFVKNELAIAAQVRIDGYVNRPIPAALLVETPAGKTQTIAEQTVQATEDGQRIPLKFRFVPDAPGEYKLSLKLEAQPGELVTTNNRLSTFVQVLKGGIRVLYVEAFPGRVERRFLIQSLAGSPDIGVDAVLLNEHAPETRPQDFSQRFQAGKYDVYLLGNIDAAAFRKEELAELAATVKRGAGLIMTGGLQSFGPGGYAETPLADVLPVKMDRLERQRPGSGVSKDLHLLGPVKMRPTPVGTTNYCLRLGGTPEESASIWTQLPPLKEGANKFAGAKPGALVLAESEQKEPLLLAQTVGEGRVLAFAGDSTWQWWMRGFQTPHKRFWRQVILWLAKKDEATEGNVWVRLNQRRFTPGQRVEFTVGAQGPSGEPVPNASFQAEVELPGAKKTPVALVQSAEATSGSFRDTQSPGDYTIRVAATQDGRDLGSASIRFLVVEQDLELDNPMADATLMDHLAAMTGGRALVPEELPTVLRELAETTENLEIQTETKKTFWDTWPFLLALVGLLSVEWYLRKRWGLV